MQQLKTLHHILMSTCDHLTLCVSLMFFCRSWNAAMVNFQKRCTAGLIPYTIKKIQKTFPKNISIVQIEHSRRSCCATPESGTVHTNTQNQQKTTWNLSTNYTSPVRVQGLQKVLNKRTLISFTKLLFWTLTKLGLVLIISHPMNFQNCSLRTWTNEKQPYIKNHSANQFYPI